MLWDLFYSHWLFHMQRPDAYPLRVLQRCWYCRDRVCWLVKRTSLCERSVVRSFRKQQMCRMHLQFHGHITGHLTDWYEWGYSTEGVRRHLVSLRLLFWSVQVLQSRSGLSPGLDYMCFHLSAHLLRCFGYCCAATDNQIIVLINPKVDSVVYSLPLMVAVFTYWWASLSPVLLKSWINMISMNFPEFAWIPVVCVL